MTDTQYAVAFASIAVALVVNMALTVVYIPRPTLRAYVLYVVASALWPIGIPLWAVYCYRDRFDLRYPDPLVKRGQR